MLLQEYLDIREHVRLKVKVVKVAGSAFARPIKVFRGSNYVSKKDH